MFWFFYNERKRRALQSEPAIFEARTNTPRRLPLQFTEVPGVSRPGTNTDTFKKTVTVEKQLEKGLEVLPKIKGAKNLNYNKITGLLTYTQSKPPKVLGMMEKIHKAKSTDPLYFFNIFFGASLLFFVLSSYWMFLPQTAIFKKAIFFTLAGLLLAAVMFLV